jgi:LAS superfamily LD-carboxypeptidase LdcB
MSRGLKGTVLFAVTILLFTATAEAKTTRKSAAAPPLDKSIQAKLTAAQRDMRRAGIKPKITSTFRTTAEQQRLYNCSHSRRCKESKGIYGAKRPGTSSHEAGFAVDIGGLTTRAHGRRALTPQGKKVVGIMKKHGFEWRYQMKDPPHFEVDPRKHGYKSVTAAIKAHQKSTKQTTAAKANSRSHIVAVKAIEHKKQPPRRRVVASNTHSGNSSRGL